MNRHMWLWMTSHFIVFGICIVVLVIIAVDQQKAITHLQGSVKELKEQRK